MFFLYLCGYPDTGMRTTETDIRRHLFGSVGSFLRHPAPLEIDLQNPVFFSLSPTGNATWSQQSL